MCDMLPMLTVVLFVVFILLSCVLLLCHGDCVVIITAIVTYTSYVAVI